MTNVCFFNSNKVWGGGEKWHYDISLRLKQQGYAVLVVTNAESELFQQLTLQGISPHQIKISNLSFLNPYKIFSICRILRQNKISTIFLNLPSDLKVAGIAAKLAGVRHIIYRRGIALPVRNSWLNRWLFRSILTGVIANSEETRRRILQNNPKLIEDHKLKILYNGIDVKAFDRKHVCQLYEKKTDEILLGTAGRLSPEKGQHHLIDVVNVLRKQGLNCTLLIAGQGKLEQQLRQYAQQLGVGKHVVFLGFVQDIKSFMETLDIFVFSSLFEGFGYVLVEAMTARKPVVAFDVGSIPEIAEHKKTGYLVEKGNIEAFAGYVKALIHDPSLRERLGRLARKRVEEKFAIEKVVEKVIELIEE